MTSSRSYFAAWRVDLQKSEATLRRTAEHIERPLGDIGVRPIGAGQTLSEMPAARELESEELFAPDPVESTLV